ncbi:MAG: N-acetylmuramoyl-L-alanine amidase [Lachnospiraceae bacterium]
MKNMKRMLAGLLCGCMLLNMNGITAFATVLNDESQPTEEIIIEEQTTEIETTETEEHLGEASLTEESTELIEEEVVDDTEVILEETEQAVPLLNYVVVGKDYITTGESQYIMVDMGTADTVVSDALLTYVNETTGAIYTQQVSTVEGTLLTFCMSFDSQEQNGAYKLSCIDYVVEDIEYNLDLAAVGVDARFGVNVQVQLSEPDVYMTDQELPDDSEEGAGVIITTPDGNEISAKDIGQAISEVGPQLTRKTSDGKVVVVLDPGHGGSDSGAVANGIYEKNANLSIALYCKAALEQYAGVVVYMTRTTDVYVGLTDRTDYAASVGADVFISIHNNSASSSSAYGAEVYYPNASYNANAHSVGQGLANAIQDRLVSLGLYDRGIKVRDYATYAGASQNDYYPDGSISDYYAVIRNSKLYGFPGLIIEHAFVTNSYDASYLNNDTWLKALGEADAAAIAEYFGLATGGTVYGGEDYSAVYDFEYYINKYSDIKKLYGNNPAGALKHFVLYGMKEGRQASEEFNVTYYKNRYVDLRNAFGSDLSLYYKHYIVSGKKEGRDGKTSTGLVGFVTKLNGVDYSSIYNYTYYQDKYPVVKSTCGSDDIKTLQYFVENGMKEGHQAIESFDVTSYAYKYYDLRKAYKNDLSKYYLHYISNGRKEGRVATGTTIMQGGPTSYQGVDYSSVFNVGYYSNKYADLRKTYGLADESYLMHFVLYGMKEGRQACENFNVFYYKNRYADLRTVYGTDLASYYKHYMNCGKKEGRDGKTFTGRIGCITKLNGVDYSAVYDMDYYQSKYSDIKKAFGEDELKTLQHFVTYGMKEGRIAKATFNVNSYRYKYPDLRKLFRSDLQKYYIHYMNYGVKEGRIATGVTTLQNPWTVYNGVDYSDTYDFWTFRSTYPTIAEPFGMDDYGLLEYYVKNIVTNTPIMHAPTTTVAQMTAYYNACATYPDYYAGSDAPNIQTFCQIYYDECVAEGVDPAIAFCQAMKETGFLRYGGDVDISQYNFAGLGATGGGVAGASFPSVRIGVRAQVQHLKAYASTLPLNNDCVDSRFSYVSRGSAPYVQWLGIQENPYGKGWATARNYGYSIINDYVLKLAKY